MHTVATAAEAQAAARRAEERLRVSQHVARSGRFALDNLEPVAAEELVVGNIFVHDGKAWVAAGSHDGTVIPVTSWDGSDRELLPIGSFTEVALLS